MTPPFASLKIGRPYDAAFRFAQDRPGGFCFGPRFRRRAGRLVGADVTGEISGYAFNGLAKRFLMRLEGRPEPEPDELPLRQSRHREVNKKLLAALSAPGLYTSRY
jgi:hypothetical protein